MHMNNLHRTFILPTLLVVFALGLSSCKKRTPPSVIQPETVRIEGVNEPPELLVPAEKKFVHTEETDALAKAVENIKGGNEVSQLPAIDAFISKYPRVGDAYPIRAAIRCMTGDLQGAKSDVEQALSIHDRIIADNPDEDRPELTAIHAKIALITGDNATTQRDLHSIVSTYSSNIQYLTDGRVKLEDKPNSGCSWTHEDVKQWLERSGNTTDAQVFQGMYFAAFAPLDDEAKNLTSRYMADLVKENPTSAQVYFYAAMGAQKIVAFKALIFSDTERAEYNRHIIELYTKALQLNPNIEAAYAERAEAYLQQKDFSAAINDYDHAISLSPDDGALWNDRGLAKQETYNKDGAVADFSKAIELKTKKNDTHALSYSLDNRGDLYFKLGSYKKALADYNTLIGLRLHDVIMFINLDFFRELYPEYRNVDDARLKEKLRRMYYPNFSSETFDQVISKPEGMHPSLTGFLPEAYLKRADVLLALKKFSAARTDYMRSQLFKKEETDNRWRVLPGLQKLAIDVQTLDAHDPANVKVWLKPGQEDRSITEASPTEFVIDCTRRTVQIGNARSPIEPPPGTSAEAVRDFFCSSQL